MPVNRVAWGVMQKVPWPFNRAQLYMFMLVGKTVPMAAAREVLLAAMVVENLTCAKAELHMLIG